MPRGDRSPLGASLRYAGCGGIRSRGSPVPGVGYAAIEGSYRDVTTGRLLAAFADKRAGGDLAPAVSNWSDAQGAFKYWAKLFRRHLDTLRGEGRGIF